MDYDFKDICYSLKKVGIKKGDAIYLTGNLSFLGKFKNKKKTLSEFYNALKKTLGKNGTMAFPTHSFYLKNKEIFDPKKTTCKTGVLPEFLRNQKNAVRQDHPYASITSLGKWAKYISANNTNDSWGENSPFERLIKLKAKVLNFGLIPRLCATSVHHSEQMAQVPYRFKKKFIQKVKVKNKIISKQYYMNVLKNKFINIKRNGNKKLFNHFTKNYKIKKTKLGKSYLYSYSLTDFYNDNIKFLKKDTYAWVGYNLKIKEDMKEKMRKMFSSMKIKKNDNVIFHSNMAGIYQFYKKSQVRELDKYFFEILIEYIGKKGTILFPAYNFDFARGKIYNKVTSPSEVGGFSNYLLKNFPKNRSLEPIFNHFVFGKLKEKIFKSEINEVFGNESIFNFMHKKNFKIICFCCPPRRMTFLHFIEKKMCVSYRFDKYFKSKIKIDDRNKPFVLKYYAGKKGKNYEIKNESIFNLFKNKKNFQVNFGRFKCYHTNAVKLFNLSSKKIKKNDQYLIDNISNEISI